MRTFKIYLGRDGRLKMEEGCSDFIRETVSRVVAEEPWPKRPKPTVLLLQRNADGSFGPDFRVAS